MDIANERELLDAFNKGDREAFGRLYVMLAPGMITFATSILLSEEDGKDIVLETFLKLFEKRSAAFTSYNSLSAYVCTLVRNRCFNHLKLKKRERERHQLYTNLESKAPDIVESLHHKLIRGDVMRAILSEIENLPQKPKEVLKMAYLENKNYEEIAHSLEMTVENVRRARNRGLESLKTVLLRRSLLALVSTISLIFHH